MEIALNHMPNPPASNEALSSWRGEVRWSRTQWESEAGFLKRWLWL